uniref:Uncharacterized protein n=1 Tax=Arundo donax TaxID=35708 RepID=A0A0A9BA69_ARUDO
MWDQWYFVCHSSA